MYVGFILMLLFAFHMMWQGPTRESDWIRVRCSANRFAILIREVGALHFPTHALNYLFTCFLVFCVFLLRASALLRVVSLSMHGSLA